MLDQDLDMANASAASFGGLAVACDVTRQASVDKAFAEICRTYGGLDILVSNAGAAWQGLGSAKIDEQVLRDSFELNFGATSAAHRPLFRS